MQSELLVQAYFAEREQARWYRALSVLAEEAGNEEDIEALNGLVADEQHHLSRLKNRMIELGFAEQVHEVQQQVHEVHYPDWRPRARMLERAEIARYEALLRQDPDEKTRDIIQGILETERLHEQNLGGKYTSA